MRLCRFDQGRVGVVQGDRLCDVTAACDALPPLRWPLAPGDHFIRNLARLRPPIEEIARRDGYRIEVKQVRLDSPVANPPRVIAAPLNYPLHVLEGNDPAINAGVHLPSHEGFATPIDKFGLFLKSQTGVVGPGHGIDRVFPDRRTDPEAELAVVIGEGGRHIPRERALAHVAGYCIGLDVTVRGPEDRSYRKSPDTYSVLGPWLVTADEIPDPGALEFGLTVNGAPRQLSSTASLIVPVDDLVARASAIYALHPGDVIMTGTPEGVAPIAAGDRIHVWIDKIGAMDVLVR